jgi:methylthioribose-1-phosphate isomerase
MIEAVIFKDGVLSLLDQRMLPHETIYLQTQSFEDVAKMIKEMVVRGAPAIGISAAYGMLLAAIELKQKGLSIQTSAGQSFLANAHTILAQSRPTAVNLFWALDRMKHCLEMAQHQGLEIEAAFSKEAIAIHTQDLMACQKMGDFGAQLIKETRLSILSHHEKENAHQRPLISVLTHCNAGALATGGYGTALGVIRSLWRDGLLERVYADETRPYLQGARLTAWELLQDGIPTTLLCDNMAAHMMQRALVQAVIVGADRIAKNGDTANKIGTYGLAVLAKAHKIPFYVVAPISTIDLQTAHGGEIEIEERSSKEVTHIYGKSIAPVEVDVRHPAFDVTPADLITAIICENGVALPDLSARRDEKIKGIWLKTSGFEAQLIALTTRKPISPKY